MSNLTKLNQINFHFLNQCNYRCKYCLIDKKDNTYPSLEQMKSWIDILSDYFQKNQIYNPRINLVGGEPLLYPKLTSLVKYIYAKGIRVSIITNGSLLTENILNEIGSYLYMIGISLDTLNYKTAYNIGRIDIKDKGLNIENLVSICKKIKSKGIILKINTVVSKFNYQEDISVFLEKINADRIKFLELYILEKINKDSIKYKTSKKEYNNFCENHNNFINHIRETNEKFDGGYIMLNNKGDFIVNINNNHLNCGNIEKKDFKQISKSLLNSINKYNYNIRLK